MSFLKLWWSCFYVELVPLNKRTCSALWICNMYWSTRGGCYTMLLHCYPIIRLVYENWMLSQAQKYRRETWAIVGWLVGCYSRVLSCGPSISCGPSNLGALFETQAMYHRNNKTKTDPYKTCRMLFQSSMVCHTFPADLLPCACTHIAFILNVLIADNKYWEYNWKHWWVISMPCYHVLTF